MKKKFNVVDYVIIFIMAAAVLGTLYMFNKKNTPASVQTDMDTEIEVSFYVPDIDEVIVKPIKVGDKAVDNLKKVSFGEVKEIVKSPSQSFAIGDDGKSHISPKEGYCSVNITLKLMGRVANDGIYIGRYQYYIGDWMVLNAGQSSIFAVISGVKR